MRKAPFKLRSGNKPTFKTMGSSPYKQDETGGGVVDNSGAGGNEEEEDKEKQQQLQGKSKLAKGKDLLVDMASAGLSAVYGTPRTNKSGSQPKTVISKDKEDKEVEDAPPTENITKNIIENKEEDTKPYDPENPDTNMKDFGLKTDERKDEYDRRGWAYDDTIEGYNRDGSKIEEEEKK